MRAKQKKITPKKNRKKITPKKSPKRKSPKRKSPKKTPTKTPSKTKYKPSFDFDDDYITPETYDMTPFLLILLLAGFTGFRYF